MSKELILGIIVVVVSLVTVALIVLSAGLWTQDHTQTMAENSTSIFLSVTDNITGEKIVAKYRIYNSTETLMRGETLQTGLTRVRSIPFKILMIEVVDDDNAGFDYYGGKIQYEVRGEDNIQVSLMKEGKGEIRLKSIEYASNRTKVLLEFRNILSNSIINSPMICFSWDNAVDIESDLAWISPPLSYENAVDKCFSRNKDYGIESSEDIEFVIKRGNDRPVGLQVYMIDKASYWDGSKVIWDYEGEGGSDVGMENLQFSQSIN